MRSAPAGSDVASRTAFAGERVAFLGRLGCLSRAEAQAIVRRLGGDVAAAPGPTATDLFLKGKPAEVGRKEAAYRLCYSIITMELAQRGKHSDLS